MTRDGAVTENLATGEVERISSREPETELASSPEESANAALDLAARATEHREAKHTKKQAKADKKAVRQGSAVRRRPSSRLQFSDEERAEATIEKYRRALLSFAAFLCGAAVTPETIKNWKDDLREKLRAVDDQHLSGRAERFLSLLWLDRLPRAVLKNSAPPVSRQQTGVNAHRI